MYKVNDRSTCNLRKVSAFSVTWSFAHKEGSFTLLRFFLELFLACSSLWWLVTGRCTFYEQKCHIIFWTSNLPYISRRKKRKVGMEKGWRCWLVKRYYKVGQFWKVGQLFRITKRGKKVGMYYKIGQHRSKMGKMGEDNRFWQSTPWFTSNICDRQLTPRNFL